MKLASYRDGSRDGQLIVVSRDLRTAAFATHCATRLQQVLDDWNFLSPQLEVIYRALNQGQQRHSFEFDPRQCMAPLPRPMLWLSASPMSGQGSNRAVGRLPLRAEFASVLGPCEALAACPDGDILRPAVGVLSGDVPRGATQDAALEGVRLLMLVLGAHPLPLGEVAASDHTGQPRCASWFSPVAVTPDECGGAWQGGQLKRPLRIHCSATPGPSGQGTAMDIASNSLAGFGELLHCAAQTRSLGAGSLVCSETLPEANGAHLLARPGDAVVLDMLDAQGLSVFGRIEATFQSAEQRS
jgi:fumarylacetoacetate (FAA) hydrolase